MNIEQFEDKVIQAMEGDLSDMDYQQLLKHAESDEKLKAIWSSYEELYHGMESVPLDIPSDLVRDKFYNWLGAQNGQEARVVDIAQNGVKKGPFLIWRKWAGAAAILICVFGFWKMYEHNQNVENTLADVSNQMKTLMEQQSSTERIKAIRVNYNPNSTSVDDKMIQVLIDVLNNDQSSNVRLAAVETLAIYMDQGQVREALIKRLAEENDGGVKLSIITSLGQQQDENLKSTLEDIVNDDSHEKFIKDEAHMQLIRFEKIDL